MAPAERLIDEIMAASRIPSQKRRLEVLRELRAHVEDFVSAGRQSGRGEEEIERLLLERFGAPATGIFGSRHTAVMALDILASAAAYLGLLSLERFFGRPLAVLAVVAAALLAVFIAAGLPPRFILFGFANGSLLRCVQFAVRHPGLRFGAALACCGVLGTVFFHPLRPR